jgi:hypothetical protein
VHPVGPFLFAGWGAEVLGSGDSLYSGSPFPWRARTRRPPAVPAPPPKRLSSSDSELGAGEARSYARGRAPSRGPASRAGKARTATAAGRSRTRPRKRKRVGPPCLRSSPFSAPPGLGQPGQARTCRQPPSRLRGTSARLVLRSLPLVRQTTESREDEVAVTDPVKDREAAAERPQSARQWHHFYLLQPDAPLTERARYAALQVAVQRVAAREASLTRPE